MIKLSNKVTQYTGTVIEKLQKDDLIEMISENGHWRETIKNECIGEVIASLRVIITQHSELLTASKMPPLEEITWSDLMPADYYEHVIYVMEASNLLHHILQLIADRNM